MTCLLHSEYESLDRDLDQLADYLTVMESRSDRLAEDARQLLQEMREARQNGTETVDPTEDLSSPSLS